jgi:hypothetical protein
MENYINILKVLYFIQFIKFIKSSLKIKQFKKLLTGNLYKEYVINIKQVINIEDANNRPSKNVEYM